MANMLASELKTGRIYKDSDNPWQVLKYEHIKSARGGATVRVKIRNLVTGAVAERSYKSNASVEDADVIKKNAQYLFKDATGFVFMDPKTYDQTSISDDVVGDSANYLKEGLEVQILYFENKPVSLDLPNSMVFEVTYTEPGYKGNTVSSVYKDATLDDRLSVKVPAFIKIGDTIKVDTRTGEYISKA